MLGRLFIFVGPPGSGKGSLSQFCIQNFGWKQLSTGALCRKHILEQTEIGKQIDFAIKSGKLISDDLMTLLVEDWLSQHAREAQTIILDGFPRTTEQAKVLTSLVKSKLANYQLSIVKLDVADDVVVQRLGGRAICANKDCQAVYSMLFDSPLAPRKNMECDNCSSILIRRSDDEPSSIVERLRVYHNQAQQLINYFMQAGIHVYQLNVERKPALIFEDFKQLIKCELYDYDKK